MTLLAWWLAVAAAPAPDPWTGRLYTSPELHLGVRPAALVSPEEWGLGVTVQATGPWW